MSTGNTRYAKAGTSVVTLITPAERQRVDALTSGACLTVHRENLDDVLRHLRTNHVSAVIVSVSCYQQQYAPSVARMVREFPRVPAVALLTSTESRASAALLSLGEQGVRTLVDARDPNGWRQLRSLVTSEHPGDIDAKAISTIREDLDDASPSTRRFFDTLFTVPRTLTTVRQFARHLAVVPTTFISRFVRQGVPTPKRYLATARLVRAAHLLENPGFSITQVAFLMEYSSPQSFSRHVTGVLQLGAAEFRRTYTGESMLQHMRESLVLPYREQFRQFDPFSSPPQWMARAGH